MSASSASPLPPHPSLEQQRKLAKELLRAVKQGDAAALARIREHLPDKRTLTLADAQFTLAREHGFRSWTALKAHIEAQAAGAADANAIPLDELRRAVERLDAAAVKRFLEQHPAAKAKLDEPLFPFGGTALIRAASRGALDLVDVLLDAGANPNRRSDWWAGPFHPLHFAQGAVADRLIAAGAVPDACAAAHLDRIDLLEEMLDADPARVHERGGDGQTPLHFARSRAAVDLLLERGADPDARDVDHRSTPAQWMLERTRGAGRYELAAYLVGRGAAADIFLAAALGLADRVREMLRADPSLMNLRTHQGEYGEKPPSSYHIYTWTIGPNLSPFQVAAQFEQPAVLEVMQAFATSRQHFLAACAAADADEARALLRAEPGLLAALEPADHRALPDAASAGNAAAVELMLELGFDPATPGQNGGNVLHCAAWAGSAATIAAALRHPAARALVNHRETMFGGTPLGWCCHGAVHSGNSHADHAEVARLLLEAGAAAGPELADAPAEIREVIEAQARRSG